MEDPSATPPPEAPFCWLAGDDCPALAAPAAELSMEALRLVLLGLPVLLDVPEVVPGELVPAWTRLLGATPPADIRNGSKE